jgi:phage terminase large subunit GpA-like protein
MHLYCRDPRAFAAEYQNDPVDDDQAGVGELKADEIACRLNGHVRGLVPTAATTLTTFIDVGQELLYWAACAWEEGFTGSVVDYGAWPPQSRTYFAYREANPTLSARYPGLGPEGQVYAGLNDLAEVLLGKDWPTDGGGTIRVSLGMVDSGWMAEVVERFARGSPHRDRLQISKGAGIGPAQTPILDRPRKPGERRGLNWIRHAPKPGHSSRLLEYNTNFFKSFIQSRLLAPVGAKGALTLFGDDPVVHRLFADHLTAEYPDSQKSERSGRTVDVWTPKPNRDNHLWDCLVGCCVAASVEGVALVSLPSAGPPTQPKKVSWAARQREKRGR